MRTRVPLFATTFCSLTCVYLLAAEPPANTGVVTAKDNLVMGAVLKDLLSYEGKDSPIRGPFSISQPLPFAKDPGREDISVADLLTRQEKERWEALSPKQVEAVGQAAEHLARRSKLAAGQFKIAVPQIELRGAQREADWLSRMIHRSVVALLPGYSASGDVAIVRLSIPWSTYHSVDGTYVLVSKAGAWTVLLRQFVYNL